MLSIHLVPPIDAAVGWRWAFIFLSEGPFLGASGDVRPTGRSVVS
jgi:hypothetical protein